MIVGLGFKLSLVPFHCGRQTYTRARLRRFPLSWRREQNRYLRCGDASVPLRTGGDSEAIRVVLAIIAFASIIFGT